jgi:hypothetical protein
MANYPNSVKNFDTKQDLTDIVYAADVNVVYDEVTAIESNLGTLIKSRDDNWGVGTFSTSSTSWTSLKARITNIENGVFTIFNNYVSTDGGDVIQQLTTGVVALTTQQKGTATDNLLNFKSDNGTVIASVSATGVGSFSLIDGGTATN